jgi:hypothetical protein
MAFKNLLKWSAHPWNFILFSSRMVAKDLIIRFIYQLIQCMRACK